MQIKKISSAMTLFIKVFIAIWIAGFGLATSCLWLGLVTAADKTNSLSFFEMKLVFTITWVVGSVAFLWIYFPMKRVRVDNENLYVSHYFHEVVMPLNNIEDIMQGRFGGNMPILIRFKDITVLGRRIIFLPKARLTFSVRPHPMLVELKQLAGLEK